MKAPMILGLALASVLALTSCDEASKLAGEVEGTWTGQTAHMQLGKGHRHDGNKHSGKQPGIPTDEMSCTPTITFTRDQGTKGGTFTIKADYTMTQGVVLTDTVLNTPVKATVAGTVAAQGTWNAKDDDEIDVVFDASKTVTTVDPATLSLQYGALTDASAASLETLKSRIASNIESQVKPAIEKQIGMVHEFDDIKVVGNTMTMEIGKTRLSFTK